MRLLHVIRGMKPESGGPLEGTLRSAEVAISNGHEVEIVSLESEDVVAGGTFKAPVTALGRGIGRYGYNSKLVPWLRRHADRFDAVILHGLWNYSSLGSWRALRKHATPYYIYSHGMMSPWFRDRFPLKHLAKQFFWTLAEGRVLRDAKYVLFTSEEERLHARNVFRGHKYREWTLGYGTLDPTGDAGSQRLQFLARFPELRSRRFLLFLGRIHPIKGCDLLIDAFAKNISAIPEDFCLVIAGPDPGNQIPVLKRLAANVGVVHRIQWLEMLQGDLKWGALRAAEALILPSHHENFGLVVAEAMACGTPVLISDKVNIWREVLKSQAGLVETDTTEGIQKLISRFLSIPVEEREKLKVAARQGFLKYFNMEKSALDLVKLIDQTSNARSEHLATRPQVPLAD